MPARKKATAVVAKPQEAVVLDPVVSLMQVISNGATNPDVDIDKMERLMEMHERLLNAQGEQAYNESMNQAQADMGPISKNALNPQTQSKYATYDQLDRALRPIYTQHGFAISYDTAKSEIPDHMKVLAYVSRGGYSRTHQVDMPSDGKGAKGGAVMSKTHASGAAMTYGMRYLLKMIFNVAVGENDTDGNDPEPGPDYITENQAATILDLLETSSKTVVDVLEYAGAKSMALVPAKKYGALVKGIKSSPKEAV